MTDTLNALSLLASRIPTMMERLSSDSATRNALLMPFLQALGYDVFDPNQVWQDFSPSHDHNAEVDCALLRDGQPVLLVICCAALSAPDDPARLARLRAAFALTRAQAGLLTNGLIYHFFLPLAATPTALPDAPTWTLDLTQLTPSAAPMLDSLRQDTWNPAVLADESSRWQRAKGIAPALLSLLHAPPADVLQALRAHLGDADEALLQSLLVRLRLVEPRGMRSSPSLSAVRASSSIVSDSGDVQLVLLIVKGIGCSVVNPARLTLHEDPAQATVAAVTAIILDDNPQKPIIHLQWSDAARALTLFGEGKRPRSIPLLRADDILQYADFIVQTLRMYEADDHEGPVFRLSLPKA
jgi:hypothetical protein